MGALLIALAIALCGGLAGGWVAACSIAPAASAARSLRLARAAVLLLAGLAGGEIASQLYDLVHSLQLNAGLDQGFGGKLLRDVNLATVVSAIRGVLFDGVLLIGLATALALLARRRRDRATA